MSTSIFPATGWSSLLGQADPARAVLAFDTLYAEGQRQYIESLSVYARQFLHQMERPEVDSIEGLEPTICIDQRPGIANPRSTVATTTEIYDYLRLLMARLGEVSCHQCGAPISQQSLEQIQDTLLALPEGTKVMLLAPLVRGRQGDIKPRHTWQCARRDLCGRGSMARYSRSSTCLSSSPARATRSKRSWTG